MFVTESSSGDVLQVADGYFGVTHGLWDSSFDAPGGSLSTPLDNFELEIIPEPATMSIFAAAGLIALKRRRR